MEEEEIQPQMNRIDADQDEIEFERNESGRANNSGLSNHPPHLRISCSFAVGYLRCAPVVVGFLPCVGTLIRRICLWG